MSMHRYSPWALASDYLRAGTGLALTAGPALLLETQPVVTVILGALAVLFGLFGLRVGLRQSTVIEAGEQALAAHGPGATKIPWGEIEQVRLDYFSTRRDGQKGWMQMRVSGPGGRVRADSTIKDFEKLAAAVVSRMPPRTAMTDTTRGNFRALGIPVDRRGEGAPA